MSEATTVEGYLGELPPERRVVMDAMLKLVRKNMPAGYTETMGFGMITYCVPLSVFPDTYNKQPLCYAALAAQKNYFSLYLMGVYGDPRAAASFVEGFARAGKKLDKGKSCVRFKSLDDLPLDVIGKTIALLPVEEYVALHTSVRAASTTKRAGKRSR